MTKMKQSVKSIEFAVLLKPSICYLTFLRFLREDRVIDDDILILFHELSSQLLWILAMIWEYCYVFGHFFLWDSYTSIFCLL